MAEKKYIVISPFRDNVSRMMYAKGQTFTTDNPDAYKGLIQTDSPISVTKDDEEKAELVAQVVELKIASKSVAERWGIEKLKTAIKEGKAE